MKVRILPFLTTLTQLTARLKNFSRGWLLVLSLKEGLVECATVCVKSEVILGNIHIGGKTTSERTYFGRVINRTLRAKNQPVKQKVKIGRRI